MTESTRDKKARYRRYVWRIVQKTLQGDIDGGSEWLWEDGEVDGLSETDHAIMKEAVREVMATAASRARR